MDGPVKGAEVLAWAETMEGLVTIPAKFWNPAARTSQNGSRVSRGPTPKLWFDHGFTQHNILLFRYALLIHLLANLLLPHSEICN